MQACISQYNNFLKTSLLSLAFSIPLSLNTMAKANEVELKEIVVTTAGLAGVEGKKVGSSFTEITNEQLQNSGSVYISDALRQVPGLSVSRSGGFGSITQLRMRGAEANHVLVLIDGIEVSNPVQGEYDFAGLLANNVERIEILRGPQSALWGSNATAGVINIITKKAQQGLHSSLFVEGGSFSTYNLAGGLTYGSKRFRAALNASYFSTEGSNISEFGSEEDGENNFTASFKGDVDILKNLNVEGVLRYTDRKAQFDPQDFAFPTTPTQGLVIDGDRETDSREVFGRISATLSLLDGHWQQKFSGAITDVKLDSLADKLKTSGTEGRRDSMSYLSTLKFDTVSLANANHTVSGLIERKHETFRNTSSSANPSQARERERSLYGVAGEYRVDLFEQLFLSAAVRYDENDTFDDATTYRLTAAYLVPDTNTRFHVSVGTGVTNPTFYEQFGFDPLTFDGNPDLKPEKSFGWDIGFEQKFFKGQLGVDVTYFNARLENEIYSTFDFSTFRSSVGNLDGTSRRRGVEVSVSANPFDFLDLKASYTYTRSEDANGNTEVRRPKHIASFDATSRFYDDKFTINLGVKYNGKNEDLEFISSTPETRVILNDYFLINVSASYKISENIKWNARIENTFDEDYQDVFSYNSPGLNAYTGLQVNF